MSIHAGSGRIVMMAMLLSLSLILTASAACPGTKLEVLPSSVIIDNAGAGALTPGMAVVMSVRVDFPDKENTTYPETSQLELTSGLDNPYWTWNIVRNGMKKDETEERKSRVIINGGVLSWPANTTESLDIRLYGIAPSVMEPKRLIVLRILDVAGTSCNDPVYQYSVWVLNTTITRERIGHLTAELARLRADAAAKNRTRTSISLIMEKIDEAQQNLDTANSTPVFEFVSVGLALDRAESAIAAGRHLLEDVPVSGTMLPQQGATAVQKELPGTPQQTPASPEPVAIPVFAVPGAGLVVLVLRRNTMR
jgi:uncharacterized small protein (DUF1192 family)